MAQTTRMFHFKGFDRLGFQYLGIGILLAFITPSFLLAQSSGNSGILVRESTKSGSERRLPFPSASRIGPDEIHVVSYDDFQDPLEAFNRPLFALNDKLYRFALIPLSQGYLKITPRPLRHGVSNFFNNIKSPVYLVNHLFQGQGQLMVMDLKRFGINSTLGGLGFFDVAHSKFGLQRTKTGFENTLAVYGVGYGVYLVLPILGPTDLRNGLSLVMDQLLNPVNYLTDQPVTAIVGSYDFFQEYAPQAEKYNTLREESEDPYIFFRNLYLQGIQRDADY